MKMAGLTRPARVEFDGFGIPRIQAHSRADAFRILGFVTARDRLFQMDLLRRKMAGRLAEILGTEVLASDRWHRTMGFAAVSSAVFASIPDDQRKVLESYSEGVNQAMADFDVFPFEFLMLGYSPEPWRAEDSLLAVLSMYTTLAWQGETERATTVMRAALTGKVLDFFLPRTDAYTEAVLSGKALQTAAPPLPAGELAQVLRGKSLVSEHSGLILDRVPKYGSNAWVVAPSKTSGKRAMLANDMHLALAVPNVWYRAELHYGDTHIAGLTLPGVPLVVSGSNRRIAWGFTASGADVSDLIRLNVDSQNPAEYRIPGGSLRFGERIETIRIRGEADESLVVRTTKWGPVLPEPLLGKPVAVRWTALDPMATN
ncbi:MAG: penicillin acylase family protein, partial [Gammaproteobacteria bacterium]